MTDPDDQPATGAERERELSNIANAKWLIDHDGKVLPVTNLFGSDVNEQIQNPILATRCVAYDADRDVWLVLGNLEPGDVWAKVGVASAGCTVYRVQ